MKKKILTVLLERDSEGMWLAELKEEPRVHSYGRTLSKAREHIRDASALWFECDSASLEFEEVLIFPDQILEALDEFRQKRKDAEVADQEAAQATRRAVLALVSSAQLSTRDASTLLHLSHQRVHQLLNAR